MSSTFKISMLFLGFWVIFLTNPALSQSPLKILPLGNSLTYDSRGMDSRPTGDKIGYRYKLYSLLTQNGYYFDFIGSYRSGWNYFEDCDNAGFTGIDSKNLADIMQTGTSSFSGRIVNGPYLNYYPADIILLEIGTNDVFSGSYSVNEVTRLLNVVDTYEQQSGRPVLVIVGTIISLQDYPCGTHSGTTLYNNNLESMIQSRIANGDKLILTDLECGAGINYYNDMWDEFHPNSTGYDKMGQKWFAVIEAINARPVVNDIPDQIIPEGSNFSTISLDNYVNDPDDPDALIKWTTSPADPQHFIVNISPARVATILPKDPDWNGTETLTFVATDSGKYISALHRSDEDAATFTITPVNDAPVIQSQISTLTMDEDGSKEILISDLNVTDVDDLSAALSLIVQAGNSYSFSGNRIYPAANFNGSLAVNVVATDGKLQSTPFPATVSVLPVNDPPTLTLPSNRSVNVGDNYFGQLSINDIDAGDNLNIIPILKPIWLSYNQTSFTLTGTPTEADMGNHELHIRGSDGKVAIDTVFFIQVISRNSEPVIVSVPDSVVPVGSLFTYEIIAQDDDEDDSLVYSAPLLPAWLQFSSVLKRMMGQPGATDVGKSDVIIMVSDGYNLTEQSFKIHVIPFTGMEELSETGQDLRLYPNPSTDFISVVSRIYALKEINIFDMTGRMVTSIIPSPGATEIKINISFLPRGLYLVRANTASGEYREKLIIE